MCVYTYIYIYIYIHTCSVGPPAEPGGVVHDLRLRNNSYGCLPLLTRIWLELCGWSLSKLHWSTTCRTFRSCAERTALQHNNNNNNNNNYYY